MPLKEPPAWDVDPAFVEKVRNALREKFNDGPNPEDLTILALCRSGQRSMAAAELLTDRGFHCVCNILEGFEGERDGDKHRNTINGWRVRQLPWEQS